MSNNVKKVNKKQKGFAMLEVMLAVLIIAIASFGVYKLYSSASRNSSVSSATGVVNQVAGAVSKYANVYMEAPTIEKMVSVGYIPLDVAKCTTTSGGTPVTTCTGFNSPFGLITYTAGSNGFDSFTLVVPNVPGSSAVDFAKAMSTMADVKIGSVAFKGDGTDAYAATNQVTLNIPKALS